MSHYGGHNAGFEVGVSKSYKRNRDSICSWLREEKSAAAGAGV
jgi:hypothetical protein